MPETQTQARRRRRKALEAASAATAPAAAPVDEPAQDQAAGLPPKKNRTCVTCKEALDSKDSHLECVICLGYAHAYASLLKPDACVSCAVLTDAERHGRTSRAYRAYELSVEMQATMDQVADEHAAAAGQAQRLWEAELRRGTKYYNPDDHQPLPPAPAVEILADDDAEGSSGSSRDDEDAEDAHSSSRSSSSGDDAEEGEEEGAEYEHEDGGGGAGEADALALPARRVVVSAPPPVVPAPGASAAQAAQALVDMAAVTAAVVAQGASAAPEPQAEAAPSQPYEDIDVIDVYKKAVERCGLTWPTPPAPPEGAAFDIYSEFLRACKKVPDKPRTKVELPVHPGFEEALKLSWNDPWSASGVSDPVKRKVYDCVGKPDLCLDSLPPMDRSLAAYLTRTDPNAYGKDPDFEQAHIKDDSKTAKAAFKYAAMAARAQNATAILMNSVSRVLLAMGSQPKPEHVAELSTVHLELLRLNMTGSEMIGRAMAKIVVLERARWLERSVPPVLRTPLKQKISAPTLFAGMIEEMRSREGQTRADSEVLGACLPSSVTRPKLPYKPHGGQRYFTAPGPKPGDFKAPASSSQRAGGSRPSSRSRPPHRSRSDGRRTPSASPVGVSKKRGPHHHHKKSAPSGGQAK